MKVLLEMSFFVYLVFVFQDARGKGDPALPPGSPPGFLISAKAHWPCSHGGGLVR